LTETGGGGCVCKEIFSDDSTLCKVAKISFGNTQWVEKEYQLIVYQLGFKIYGGNSN
jgi:hypothetical protein